MFLSKQCINDTIYIYEQSSHRDKDTGKVVTKRKICGKLDENNNFIPSKGRNLEKLPAEILEITKITKEFRVVKAKKRKKKRLMVKILFVCHGNICRSPMAEFIMKELVRRKNLEGEFLISSAATTNDEIGNDTYPNAKDELNCHSIPIECRSARRITPDDYSTWDYIIAMDQENLQDLNYIMKGDPENKIKLLMSFAGENREVSDPWYTRNFCEAFNDIYKGCEALLNKIADEL